MEPGPSLRNEKKKISNSIPDVRNVFQSVWIRRDTDNVDETNRFLFRSQFGFVLACGVLFWTLLLIFRN
jgi:hypothetical protein